MDQICSVLPVYDTSCYLVGNHNIQNKSTTMIRYMYVYVQSICFLHVLTITNILKT